MNYGDKKEKAKRECSNCKFYSDIGECRYIWIKWAGEMTTAFPRVNSGLWCGKWERRVSE